ncbi:GGDEF domain-containing protein [Thalassotalea ganghwensis]
MIKLNDIVNIGSNHLPFNQANKVRITNIVALITTFISATYTSYYFFALDTITMALINTAFTLSYLGTIVLNRFELTRSAKVWFFVILMFHLVICTNLYLTKESGFHLYFFLVPTGAFLLFNIEEKREKFLLSMAAVILFFYCENTINTSPMIVLSDEINHMLFQSVIFVNMVEVVLVMTIFINQIECNEQQLSIQATTDELTKIYNRRCFFEKGEYLTNLANRGKRPLSVVLIDFDYFKSINDKYGHFAGDICLKEICKVIKGHCRSNDVFARLGGEEFVLALPETTLTEAEKIADRIRQSIAEHVITIKGDIPIKCTASIGISSNEQHQDDIQKLLGQADAALYKAKEEGRNRVKLFGLQFA